MGTSIGATMAWWLAAKHPDRVATLVCINIPHPGALAEGRSKTGTSAEGQNAKFSYIREAAREGNERNMFEAMLAADREHVAALERQLEAERQRSVEPPPE